MDKFTDHFSLVQTPQDQPIPGENQVKNSAGGYGYKLDDWGRLERFLILGTEGGSYYASEKEMTQSNAKTLVKCLKADGPRTVDTIKDVSTNGRAYRNTPALFALAIAAGMGDAITRREALHIMPKVARTGTHLFQFVDFVQHFRGWGRGLKGGVAAWYQNMDPERLAYQMVKYRQRQGFTHRDVLRLAKPKPIDEAHGLLYKWVTSGEVSGELPPIIEGFLACQEVTEPKKVAQLISEYRLPREAVPPEFLKDAKVWDALLESMPLTAMIRNLGNLSKCELVTQGSQAAAKVVEKLQNQEALKKARIHPLGVLTALSVYKAGRSMKGSGTWQAVPKVCEALDEAFYKTFENVVPSNKRFLLAIDASGSMSASIARLPGVNCRDAAAAMAMVTLAKEPQCEVVAFTDTMTPIFLTKNMQLDRVSKAFYRNDWGGTDCAQPMLWAQKNKLEFDAFVVYTDSETWCGDIHATQALTQYRKSTGIPAKLIVAGMVSNGFSIADPSDPGMLDVVGFDTQAPSVMSDFARDS